MAARTRRRSRLVVRIYLASLATMALTVAVTIAFARLLADDPDDPRARMERDLARLERVAGDREALAREARRIAQHGPSVAVFDADRNPIAASGPLPSRPLPPDAIVSTRRDRPASGQPRPSRPPDGAEPGPGGRGPDGLRPPRRPLVHALERDGAVIGLVHFGPPRRPHRERRGPPLPPTIALVTVGLLLLGGSLWFARRLVAPLQRIEATAIAFGRGEHAARAGLARADEIGAVGRAFDDMADRVTALMASQRELMANVGHELRTPLASIRVALDLAAEGNAETARELVAEIDADLAEIERLIDDVTTSARLDLRRATGAALRLEEIDLRELLARTGERFRALHDSHPLAIEAAPLTVLGEPSLLRRALDNVVDNARKYSERGRPIAIRAAPAGAGRARIEVVDRGIGIDAADLPHVFSPFFRSDQSRARSTGGVGLGLSLARKIVEAHGGTIELVSRPGDGTTATIELPTAGAPDVSG